jgi:anion-transporting  ArsA/GET3 family ATPase
MMKLEHEKLIAITGKGGVGKTLMALSLTHALKRRGKKVMYLNLHDSPEIPKELNIPVLDLDVQTSMETYIAKKLNSKHVASWIMKTPFFISLVKILPSLVSMVFLGHIIDILKSDKDMHIVLDSPSTGHFLSLFESPNNFKHIFKTGPLVQDIDKMLNFMQNEKWLKVFLLSIPTELSLNESSELSQSLKEIGNFSINNILNFSYSKLLKDEANEAIPPFLLQKIQMEKNIIEDKDITEEFIIPYCPKETLGELVLECSSFWEGLL